MTCDTAVDLIIDSLVDELDPVAAARLEGHLATCRSCAAEALALRRLWEDLHASSAPIPSSAAAVRFGRRLERARSPSTGWRRALIAATVVLAVGTGTALGRWAFPLRESAVAPQTVSGSPFLLLVRGNERDRGVPRAQLVREYGAFESELASEGRLLAADKLADDAGRWVVGNDSTSRDVGGFFLIVAADHYEAEAIARRSPYVAYGGTMEIRAVERR